MVTSEITRCKKVPAKLGKISEHWFYSHGSKYILKLLMATTYHNFSKITQLKELWRKHAVWEWNSQIHRNILSRE